MAEWKKRTNLTLDQLLLLWTDLANLMSEYAVSEKAYPQSGTEGTLMVSRSTVGRVKHDLITLPDSYLERLPEVIQDY